MRAGLALALSRLALVGCGASETQNTQPTREATTVRQTDHRLVIKPGYCGEHQFGPATGEIVQLGGASCDQAIAIATAHFEGSKLPPMWHCGSLPGKRSHITQCFTSGPTGSGSQTEPSGAYFEFRPTG